MLQLKKRNVPAAAHSFSILAKKDERELEFLLNFVDAKQQQHLSQVQSFFDGHIYRIGENKWEEKSGCGDVHCIVLNRSM